MADPYRYFRIEAGEILEQLQSGLLELEKAAPSTEVLGRLLRLAHTLKGAARVVKQKTIADASHALEDLLVPLRDTNAALPPTLIGAALEHVDAMRAQLKSLAPEPDAAQRSPKNAQAAPDESFWAASSNSEDLDILMDGLTELNSQLSALRRSLDELERAQSIAKMLSDQLAQRHASEHGELGASQLRLLAQELEAKLGVAERGLFSGAELAERELGQVRDSAERLRLVPTDLLWGSLERTARDAALSVGKRVRFSARGNQIRLDATVLGLVQRALLQTVRNAVAHGIESAAERAASSKPPDGEIRIDVVRRDQRVAFSCRDDGRGLDLAAVRRRLEQQGLANASVAAMDASELARRLLQGGISTARAVTAVAGRGIGLDLVRETAEQLGGSVTLDSVPGAGTTVTIAVPVRLSSVPALLVEVRSQVVALPLSAVRSSSRVSPEQIAHGARGESVVFEQESVPYAQLAPLLGIELADGARRDGRSAVLLQSEAGRAAFEVDRLLGVENIVVRAVPELSLLSAVISGASFDADGIPRLVLSPDGLVRAAQRRTVAPRVTEQRPAPILVIDDSLTTRMLEQSILESAGYEVELATSGEEGLKKAKERRYSLFLVDVEMPGMDGFSFIEYTRKDPTLRDIPAILVTSRASAADLQRGREVGARAHIEKKEFNQTDLLERIRRLVS